MPVGQPTPETDNNITPNVGVIDISGFGEKLRVEREKQGFDLNAVAEETKIRKLYLNALEEEDFAILPPRVYATGFVARYAKFLNMDSEALVSEFQSLAYKNKPNEKIVVEEEKTNKNVKFPIKNIIGGALFLFIVVWAGNYLVPYISQRGAAQPPSVQEPKVNQNNQNKNNQNQNQNNQGQKLVTNKLVLDIAARENCWLNIRVDGIDQYTGIMTTGQKQSFTANQSIIIRAGNAGGVDLTLNNKKLAPLGESGQVIEKQYDINSVKE